MATRLTLLCHAATRSMREGGFGAAEEALDAGGLRLVARHPLAAVRAEHPWCSPARAAMQTADALGWTPVAEPALRDIAGGGWAGRGFADVQQSDPAGFAAWIGDPAAGAPGGETLAGVADRVSGWLTAVAAEDRAVVAVTHPMVIRAIVAAAIGLPVAATVRIDIAPLSSTTLSFNRMWRLQSIQP